VTRGAAGRASSWAELAELGTLRALRFGIWLQRRLGRRPLQAVLWLSALYFAASGGSVRRASLRYLQRLYASPEGRAALGRPPGFAAVVRHLHAFAENLADRVAVWGGGLAGLTLVHDGSQKLFSVARAGRGGILLGAHLGSFDMLRLIAERYEVVVNVLLYERHAERINALFESLSPRKRVRIIELDPTSLRAAFAIRACLARGEFVAILADRMRPGQPGRAAEVAFLGRPARFPLAPFLLPALIGCPAHLALCVRTGPGRYQTLLRPLAGPRRVPRREREKYALELLERYVRLLEATCQEHPFQWFNFYDFWGEEEVAAV
jgi:predicted LPLAT superfamily acyltransferase